MTSKERGMLARYDYAQNSGYLHEVYGRFSNAKCNAMEYCERLQRERNGYGGKICSYNTFMFTYGFKYDADDGTHLMYITPSYDYDFLIA